MEPKNAWLTYSEADLADVEMLSARYRAFLDAARRARVRGPYVPEEAEARGFRPLAEAVRSGAPPSPGDKLMQLTMGKTLALFLIGRAPLEEGMNLVGAHIDSPRLDVKQNPLFEEEGLAAWIPTTTAASKNINGSPRRWRCTAWWPKPTARSFPSPWGRRGRAGAGISDLLAHLSKDQLDKKAAALIEGEAMDVIVGSRPLAGRGEAAREGVRPEGPEGKIRRRGEGLPVRRAGIGARRKGAGLRAGRQHDHGLWPRRPQLRLCIL